ncbi:nuclear transport factor 2 family protein [Vulgatibacter incomptus]|uniref:Uncharacterized protein n=1 Tax=Vulgatibacter incomptus TaxID=1391653 RepID=A0A0K1PCT8_9BACT|nr:nuclear transport factor 2 family protein [Vulgatibacter incomptus]AKU91317.1 hypothetical protein AKJ08_1704 [Vulgatibacter incomptus]
MKRLLLLPLAAVLALSACTTRYIGQTRIEDNEVNREVLRVVEQYRRAIEDRDAQRVLELTADDFFEDPGTPNDPSDDYDKGGLRHRLEQTFSKMQDQRLRIEARKVELSKDGKQAFVEYRFEFRYRLNLANSTEWRDASDLNRVTLKRVDGAWKFVAGL